MYKWLLVLVVLAFVVGCGGGGGGTGLSVADVPLSTNNIRQLQPGDSLTYSLTGTMTVNGVSSALTGNATFITSNDNVVAQYGNRALKSVISMNITANNQTFVINDTVYMEQDSNGTIYDMGGESDGRLTSATSTPYMYISPMMAGNTVSYTANYTNTNNDNNTSSVINQESAAGYTAYKIYSVNTDSNSYDWFVPAIGYPVKSIIQQSWVEAGDNYHLSATMTMTNKNF